MSSPAGRRLSAVPPSDAYATVAVVRDREVVHSWSVVGCGPADLGVVDHLARVLLTARRFGWSIRLSDVRSDLAALLEVFGLSQVLCVEVGRQSELGEQVRVEEAVVSDDPIA
jgi:predicted fused transcriptional regulator/phosphomethylpyrimidine kinase